ILQSSSFRQLAALNPTWNMEKAYTLPEETRYSGIAKLMFENGGLTEVRFIPAYLADDSAPMPLSSHQPEFQTVRDYLRDITCSGRFSTTIVEDGDEFVLTDPS